MIKRRLSLAVLSAVAATTAVAVCAQDVVIDPASSEIQLMPAGSFRARDGRPGNGKSWYIDADIAKKVVDLAHQRKTPFVIDYEHQTLKAKDNGQPAPAAGWFSRLEWRDGDGLYAVDVTWTPKATEYLQDKEYRFISPVFSYAASGEVVELLMAAITNFPAVDGMDEVLAAASTFFTNKKSTEEPDMDLLNKLLAKLGLDENATEEQAVAALSALTDKAGKADEAETQVAELQTQLEQKGNPDPEKYVPVAVVEDLKTQVADLTSRINDDEVAALVAQGIEDKKLLPAQQDWAVDLGKSNIASLRSYLDNAQPIAALSGSQTQGKKPGDEGFVPDDSLVAVCSQMGLDANEVAKQEA